MQGVEKGLLPFNHQPMIKPVIAANKDALHIAISCNRATEQYQALVKESSIDTQKPVDTLSLRIQSMLPNCFQDQESLRRRGPMAGVLSYFLNWKSLLDEVKEKDCAQILNRPVVVTSCDMALLDHKLIARLVKAWHTEKRNCITASTNGSQHFLPFVITLEVGIEATTDWINRIDSIARKDFSIRNWLTAVDTKTITLGDEIQDYMFLSANSPPQLDEMQTIARNLHQS